MDVQQQPVVDQSGMQVQPVYLILIIVFAAGFLVVMAVMATWVVMSQQRQLDYQSTEQQDALNLPLDNRVGPPASGQNSQPEGMWNVPQYGAAPTYNRGYTEELEQTVSPHDNWSKLEPDPDFVDVMKPAYDRYNKRKDQQ